MDILTYTYKEISDLLEKNNKKYKFSILENKSLLTFMTDQSNVDELNLNYHVNTFNDIDWKADRFVFDFLSELTKLMNVKELYFHKTYLAQDTNVKLKNIKEVDVTKIHGSIYKQAILVLINKITRNFHNKDILLLDLRISNKFKKHNNELIKLSEEEKEEVNRLNLHLNRLVRCFQIFCPYVKVIKIMDSIFMTDFINYEFQINSNMVNQLNTSFEENLLEDRFNGEKVFPSINPIRYCFEKARFNNKDKLLVIFSAFSTDYPKYNYMNTLKTCDCNKLFILDDYGTKGVYYLGLKGEFNIESSVISLITSIMSENNILFNNVTAIGSSKGGTAALYYGMKYNFGSIITGAPQYKIGTYLSDLSIDQYAKEIFGIIHDANRIKYNNLIRLVANNKSKIYMLTSDGDNQYKKVLKEFEYVARELDLKLQIDKCNIKNHGEISKEFPKYIYDKLDLILSNGYINLNSYNNMFINIKNFIRKNFFKVNEGEK